MDKPSATVDDLSVSHVICAFTVCKMCSSDESCCSHDVRFILVRFYNEATSFSCHNYQTLLAANSSRGRISCDYPAYVVQQKIIFLQTLSDLSFKVTCESHQGEENFMNIIDRERNRVRKYPKTTTVYRFWKWFGRVRNIWHTCMHGPPSSKEYVLCGERCGSHCSFC